MSHWPLFRRGQVEKGRMSHWLFVLALLVFVVTLTFWATPAQCVWCPSYACYNSMGCGLDCVCIFPPPKHIGTLLWHRRLNEIRWQEEFGWPHPA